MGKDLATLRSDRSVGEKLHFFLDLRGLSQSRTGSRMLVCFAVGAVLGVVPGLLLGDAGTGAAAGAVVVFVAYGVTGVVYSTWLGGRRWWGALRTRKRPRSPSR